jgi:hypothetical protein
MALSPFYGWSEPDNSSLVKNGAADIRTLGDAIDTSVWNVGYGQAGKNKFTNGDFNVNQRSFTSTTTNGAYTFDRWRATTEGDGSGTFSAQTFTLGTAPVAGYEGKNFLRIVTASQTSAPVRTIIGQRIESVRTFAGQTVTLSFWAKAATGTPKLYLEPQQQFGTGGSPSAANTEAGQQVTLSTSWVRYSATFSIDSIAGKTLGTNNDDYLQMQIWVSAGTDYNARTSSLGIQSNTFDFWGMQVEYGSKATPFQTATGTIAGELQLAQRYYYRWTTGGNANAYSHSIFVYIGTEAYGTFPLPTTMRVNPTVLDTTGTAADYRIFVGGSFYYPSVVPSLDNSNNGFPLIKYTVASGLTAGQAGAAGANATNNTYLGFSAEL